MSATFLESAAESACFDESDEDPDLDLPTEKAEAWERYGTPGRFVFTCEHASHRVPAPLATTEADRGWLRTHWGYDIGARTLTRELVRRMGGTAVLGRFTRLVVDANREPEHRDLVRTEIDGHRLSFNDHLAEVEVFRRVRDYHQPFHAEIDRVLRASQAQGAEVVLISVHSFTPVWSQHLRLMDAGVLFDDHEDDALRLHQALLDEGLDSALNAPYSGRDGLIYSASRHGRACGVRHIELEVNQSLIRTPAHARRLGPTLARALLATYPG